MRAVQAGKSHATARKPGAVPLRSAAITGGLDVSGLQAQFGAQNQNYYGSPQTTMGVLPQGITYTVSNLGQSTSYNAGSLLAAGANA